MKMNLLKNSFTNFFFMTFLFMSLLLSMSSNSMLWIWLGMELNTLMVLPMIMINNNLVNMEQIMKYFIIQSISSNILFMSMLSFYLFLNLNMSLLNKMFMLTVIMFKMGSAPFHLWFLSFLKKMKWSTIFIMMSVQKIIPFMLLILLNEKTLMMVFIILNSIFGSFMGLNQFSTRKVLYFSSLTHMSWMFLSMMFSMKLFKLYLYLYVIFNLMVCNLFSEKKLNFIFQSMKIFNPLKKESTLESLSLFMMILFFMGLPPMIGFFPKFLIILKSSNMLFFVMTIMIFMNLLSMVFYTRVMLNFLLNSKYMNKMDLTMNLNLKTNMFKLTNTTMKNFFMFSTTIYLFYKIM